MKERIGVNSKELVKEVLKNNGLQVKADDAPESVVIGIDSTEQGIMLIAAPCIRRGRFGRRDASNRKTAKKWQGAVSLDIPMKTNGKRCAFAVRASLQSTKSCK